MVICPYPIIFLANFVKKVGEAIKLEVIMNEAATKIKINETAN